MRDDQGPASHGLDNALATVKVLPEPGHANRFVFAPRNPFDQFPQWLVADPRPVGMVRVN